MSEVATGMNEKTEDIEQLVDAIETYIQESMKILEHGDYVELNGLQDEIASLCKQVMHIPAEQGSTYAKKMEDLMKQLDLLKSLMRDHQEKVQQELEGVDVKRQASVAYAKSEALTPMNKKDN